jgi:hypothetical protein
MAFSIPNLPYFLAKCVLAMQRQRHETVCRLLCTASLSIRDSMSRTAEPFIRLEIEDGWERLLSVERHLSEGSVIPQHTQKPPDIVGEPISMRQGCGCYFGFPCSWAINDSMYEAQFSALWGWPTVSRRYFHTRGERQCCGYHVYGNAIRQCMSSGWVATKFVHHRRTGEPRRRSRGASHVTGPSGKNHRPQTRLLTT